MKLTLSNQSVEAYEFYPALSSHSRANLEKLDQSSDHREGS